MSKSKRSAAREIQVTLSAWMDSPSVRPRAKATLLALASPTMRVMTRSM